MTKKDFFPLLSLSGNKFGKLKYITALEKNNNNLAVFWMVSSGF
jgi:hypothetical protein